ncbi:MAG: PCYCGC domain-containing protein [Chloroflexota bacterium]|nr:PCYCGC domain-containing protein [Chloroflexota bacterium]
MRRRSFLIGLAGLGLAACARGQDSVAPTMSAQLPLIATPSRNIWPAQYRQAPAAVQEAYAFALAHPAVLKYVPCFCGCGATGHLSNYDCFARSQTTPGSFVLDAHGFACGTCVGVALDSKSLLEQGLSVKAIRQAIDARWSSAGPATRTPMPD